MSIRLENVTKLFGEQNAVNDISFEVKTGEIVGFLGPNGAGKTTTMKKHDHRVFSPPQQEKYLSTTNPSGKTPGRKKNYRLSPREQPSLL